mmetsp:Transcript_923/g.1550  ORF Transcript_923/g.1550 Transcript_923/m.1550 type:complete len:125 (+) Transcript_923:153-527(+)
MRFLLVLLLLLASSASAYIRQAMRGRLLLPQTKLRAISVANAYERLSCTQPIETKDLLLPFTVTCVVGYYGFQTKTNKERGEGATRRALFQWIAIQTVAAGALGPALTNPCSSLNSQASRPSVN